MGKRIFHAVSFVLAALCWAGCVSSHSTRLHVAVADVDSLNPELKFYRVTINAKSSNKKATLQTGYFDANAVRQLFGEIKPKSVSSASSPRSGAQAFVFDSSSRMWVKMSDDELFTVVFGADAKALAKEIELMASSDATGDQMGRLLAAAAGGSTMVEAVAEEKVSAEQRAKIQVLAGALKKAGQLENLKDDTTAEDFGKVVALAAQRTLAAMGSSTQLKTNDATAAMIEAEAALKALTPAR